MATRIDYLVSVHDVMPETLGRVLGLVGLLDEANLGPATLLVVAGRDWRRDDIAVLERLAADGHVLAGHGWSHHVVRYRNLAHRLHGLLLSKRAAEHLEHDGDGIRALVRRSRDWFGQQPLPAPTLYVPPAWAMGSVPRADLAGLGFRYYEDLAGLYDARTGTRRLIPLLGFEADTPIRAASLRVSNAVNRRLARRTGVARLALHPYDLDLALADDLRRAVRHADGTTSVAAVLAA